MHATEALQRIQKIAERSKYQDISIIKIKGFRLAYRGESLELTEQEESLLVSRALSKGYGIASTTKVNTEELEKVAKLAIKNANNAQPAELSPVKPERGTNTISERKPFTVEEAQKLLSYIKYLFDKELSFLKPHIELILDHEVKEREMASTEGHNITERIPYSTLVLYASLEKEGASVSEVVGGIGGLEVLISRDWERIIKAISERLIHSIKAKVLSPLVRGSRFTVILDEVASGFLAHEIAHSLEAENFNPYVYSNVKPSSYAKLIDDPHIPYGYGSRVWDDEGVRTVRKTLISEDQISLLHTRLTAREGERPGNARGILHKPKALMSNTYFMPGDWRVDEIFQETREAIFIRGATRAEVNTSTGILTLQAEVGYYYKKNKGLEPLKGVTIQDSIRRIISAIDAASKVAGIRPNIEKGYNVSDGGPYLRLDRVRCA